MEAKGWRNVDLWSKSGHSCVIDLSGRHWRTLVIKNTHKPRWNFEVSTDQYRLGGRIIFSVYDHDMLSDDFLGMQELSCTEWGYPGGFVGELALTNRHVRAGADRGRLRVDAGPLKQLPRVLASSCCALQEWADLKVAPCGAGPLETSETREAACISHLAAKDMTPVTSGKPSLLSTCVFPPNARRVSCGRPLICL